MRLHRGGCDGVEFCHVKFGTVLGEDGRPFKNSLRFLRSALGGLLDEAIRRAGQVVRENNPELCESECESIADTVGIGALKICRSVPKIAKAITSSAITKCWRSTAIQQHICNTPMRESKASSRRGMPTSTHS